jgi:hypothetical protein
VSAAKQYPHRPGLAPALGLRAGSVGPGMGSQTAGAAEPPSKVPRRPAGQAMSLPNVLRPSVVPRLEILENRTAPRTGTVPSPADDGGAWRRLARRRGEKP